MFWRSSAKRARLGFSRWVLPRSRLDDPMGINPVSSGGASKSCAPGGRLHGIFNRGHGPGLTLSEAFARNDGGPSVCLHVLSWRRRSSSGLRPSLTANGGQAISNVSLGWGRPADGLCVHAHHNMTRRIPMAARNSGNLTPPDPRSATCRYGWSKSRLLRIFRYPALARAAR